MRPVVVGSAYRYHQKGPTEFRFAALTSVKPVMSDWETVGDVRRGGAPRIACDAMCGGLARWLRVLGVDAAYTPGISDSELVAFARRECRIVVSSDRRLFLRRVFQTGELSGILLRPGLRLMKQVQSVCAALSLEIGPPRCTHCGGELAHVDRTEVGDRVPARSLIWASEFQQCGACGRVFWRGTHWRRIEAVRRGLNPGAFSSDGGSPARGGAIE